MNIDLRVIVDSRCAKDTDEPLVRHAQRWWMPRWWHDWKQRRLIKRYGFVKEPMAILTPAGLIVHPAIMMELKAQRPIIAEVKDDGSL